MKQAMDELHTDSPPAGSSARRRANVRLACILASIALVFFVGFIARIALYGPN
jgi:hypothetical protein